MTWMAECWLDDSDVMPKGYKEDFDPGRCNPCDYAERVTAQDGFVFLGCVHAPYNGKWVAEIKDCPKGGYSCEETN